MFREAVAIAALACAGTAFGQVIHEPPGRVEMYNPFNDRLNEQAVKRLWALSQHWVVLAPGARNEMVPGEYYSMKRPSDVDPMTGEVLSFKGSDLVPPRERRAEEKMAEAPAETQPAPKGEFANEIVIKPWKPHPRETTVNRDDAVKSPAEKGQIIIKPSKP